jgi:hypothetical protein
MMKFSGEILSCIFVRRSGGEDGFYNRREERRRLGWGDGSIRAAISGFRV